MELIIHHSMYVHGQFPVHTVNTIVGIIDINIVTKDNIQIVTIIIDDDKSNSNEHTVAYMIGMLVMGRKYNNILKSLHKEL